MSKLGYKKAGWSPAKLGANTMSTFLEDAFLPIAAGTAGPVLLNMVLKQSPPEVPLLFNSIGTLSLFVFADNKLFGAGAAIGTIVSYLQRKFGP